MSKKFKAIAAITFTMLLTLNMTGCKIGAVFCLMEDVCSTTNSQG